MYILLKSCLGIYPEVELLDHMMDHFQLFQLFEEPLLYCFPSWLYQFRLPPTTYKSSLFTTPSPALTVSCLLDSHSNIVRYYLLVVLICISLVISDVEYFSCVCWPCCFWRNVYSVLPPIFKSDCFCYWVDWVLYIFWVWTSYMIYGLQKISPIL